MDHFFSISIDFTNTNVECRNFDYSKCSFEQQQISQRCTHLDHFSVFISNQITSTDVKCATVGTA